MANETIITNGYQLTNEGVRLHFCPVANGYIFLYFNEGTNEAIVANTATIQVYWLNNFYAFAKNYIVLDY